MAITNFPDGVSSFGVTVTGGGIPAPSLNGRVLFVDGTNGSNGNEGTNKDAPLATITKAESIARSGDVIAISPGSYNETVTVNVANLTFVGLGGRGAVYIEPSAAGAEGMQITNVDDVTLINIGIDGDDTADYALNLNDVSRFRAYGCKFELGSGTGPAVLLDGDANGQVGDALFRDCEFAWAGVGLQADDSAYGVPTQIFVDNCRFHNITTACINEKDAGAWYTNLQVTNCVFDTQEDGTEPTDWVVVDHASSSGIFSGNRFATATNATGVLTIGAQVMWVANATEAGWSTARPA